jgi:hypothetical protein
MPVRAQDVAALTVLLSAERLSALTTLTGSNEMAIALHQDTLKLGASLMGIIATVEIALRNTVAENLSQHFGVPNWLQQPPVAFVWKEPERKKIALAVDSAKRAEYAKLSQEEKHNLDTLAYPQGRPANTPHLKRAKDRRRHIVVTEGKVIAELTLYFWKRLYGPEYDQSLWRTTLKRTFPDKKLARADIATQLERIYQSRNRLAHHEPVLHKRFADTLEAVEFVTQRLSSLEPTVESALASLLSEDLNDIRSREEALRQRLAAYRIQAP